MSSGSASVAQQSLAEEARIRDELIKEHKLVRPGNSRKGTAWKSDMIWLSTLERNKKKFYCIDCKRWYSGDSHANVKQHVAGQHRDHWAALRARYEAPSTAGTERDGEDDASRIDGDGGTGSVTATSVSAPGDSMPRGGERGGGLVQSKLGYLKGEPLMRLHRSLTGFLIRDMRPFNLIEGEGFVR
jgi:hypothetical protein